MSDQPSNSSQKPKPSRFGFYARYSTDIQALSSKAIAEQERLIQELVRASRKTE